MISIEHVSFHYPSSEIAALDNISLNVKQGECLVLLGMSGCGKTSLTRLLNGLIPHYYNGHLTGKVTVGNLDIVQAELYETAHLVGSVFQNPRSQFFCVDTTSEIAFGCENAGLPAAEIKNRIVEAVNELDMAELLDRNVFHLSGGEKQKVACASVTAMHPDVFVLDEPTANLDMASIRSLRETLLYWKSQGKTIIIAEHRLYWLLDICDRALYMKEGRIEYDLPIADFLQLSEQDRHGMGLRMCSLSEVRKKAEDFQEHTAFQLENFRFTYDQKTALDCPSLCLPQGATIALVGQNGAGKSTLSRCLCGLEKRCKGTVTFQQERWSLKKRLQKSYLVMQDVNHQLFCETVADEVQLGMSEDSTFSLQDVFERLDLTELGERHPMSLSGGQKQRVAIAAALLAGKQLLIFDEPTSGLDYENMERISALLTSLRSEKTVLVISHDPEFIMACCTHVIHLDKGAVSEAYALAGNENKLLSFFNIE